MGADSFQVNVLQRKELSELTSLLAILTGEPLAETSSANRQGFAFGLF